MADDDLINSLSELIKEDVVEIDDFNFRVFIVSQINLLRDFHIDVGFSCLYHPDFPEEKMNHSVLHLDSLYDYKIRILNFRDYVGWKYKTLSREIKYLEL